MLIGQTDIIAGKALTDQGSGDVNGDAEIFAGLVTESLVQAGPAKRTLGQNTSVASDTDTPTETANAETSDAAIDPALVQNSQLAAIFSSLTLSTEGGPATSTGVSGSAAGSLVDLSTVLVGEASTIVAGQSGQTLQAAVNPLTGLAQSDLTVPKLVEEVTVSGEGTALRVAATAIKSDGSAVTGGKTSSTSSLLADAGSSVLGQTTSTDLTKTPVMPNQASTKLTELLQSAGLTTDSALSMETLTDLVGDDATINSDGDLALQLKTDVKTGETAQAQATRTLSSSQMAAVVSRVSEQFLERFNGKTSTFEIRLDPPELGKVDVRVEVGSDGKVMAVIAARDPAVADALMRGAKTLENALTQAGLTLSEGGVRVEIDQNNGSGFSGANGDEVADMGTDLDDLDSPSLAEAGDDATVIPVIESWSRHRLDVTA